MYTAPYKFLVPCCNSMHVLTSDPDASMPLAFSSSTPLSVKDSLTDFLTVDCVLKLLECH